MKHFRDLATEHACIAISASKVTQATHFETVMTTLDEVSDKTKAADEFILRSVLLDCFTAELDE